MLGHAADARARKLEVHAKTRLATFGFVFPMRTV
jgi:hypothetical protein